MLQWTKSQLNAILQFTMFFFFFDLQGLYIQFNCNHVFVFWGIGHIILCISQHINWSLLLSVLLSHALYFMMAKPYGRLQLDAAWLQLPFCWPQLNMMAWYCSCCLKRPWNKFFRRWHSLSSGLSKPLSAFAVNPCWFETIGTVENVWINRICKLTMHNKKWHSGKKFCCGNALPLTFWHTIYSRTQVMQCSQAGDGNIEHRYSGNQWTKMNRNRRIQLGRPLYLLLWARIIQ